MSILNANPISIFDHEADKKSYASQMTELFLRWQKEDLHKDHAFVRDGIIDYDAWVKAPVKILFILKEASDSSYTEGHWDLATLITDKEDKPERDRTFIPAGQWAHAIFQIANGDNTATFVDATAEIYQALKATAIINIKKSNGKGESDYNDLKKYADQDWSHLETQIKLIKPDLIVCGYTWDLIQPHLNTDNEVQYHPDNVSVAHGFHYLDFWHPSNRAANLMNFYALWGIVYKAYQERNLSPAFYTARAPKQIR